MVSACDACSIIQLQHAEIRKLLAVDHILSRAGELAARHRREIVVQKGLRGDRACRRIVELFDMNGLNDVLKDAQKYRYCEIEHTSVTDFFLLQKLKSKYYRKTMQH